MRTTRSLKRVRGEPGGGRDMRRLGLAAAVAVVGVPVAAGAASTGAAKKPSPAAAIKAPRQVTEQAFRASTFSHPTRIDNKWLPMVPGTQFVYDGRATRGPDRQPHRIVTTITDLGKVVAGVRALAIWDRDFSAGRLVEEEVGLFAQADNGDIFKLGQYVEEYEGRKFGATTTWLVGRRSARPGLHIQGDPRPGTPAYSQGYAPEVKWGDIAKVAKTGQKTCVPVGCYSDVIVTDETNPLEPGDGHQLKLYAAGVGNVRAAPGRGDKEREVLALTRIVRLSPKRMAAARNRVLTLDRRAYRLSKRVWHGSPRAQRLP